VSDQSSIAGALVADAGGPGAPPRRNGELVFEAPWESRAFGMAIALSEAHTCDWEQFRSRLIDEIGAWEREHGGDSEARWSYYERWLNSLERLLLEEQLLSEQEIEARAALLEHEQAHEHDHEHGHHHHDHAH
jgi:nitrile hydratase accessory protein